MRWEAGGFSDLSLRIIRQQMAIRLRRAAIALQTLLKAELSTPYPPASTPGQYPHARTYTGRNSVVVVPESLKAIEKTLTIRIGFLQNAWYMGYLEAEKQRLGLKSKYKELTPLLHAMLKGEI